MKSGREEILVDLMWAFQSLADISNFQTKRAKMQLGLRGHSYFLTEKRIRLDESKQNPAAASPSMSEVRGGGPAGRGGHCQ